MYSVQCSVYGVLWVMCSGQGALCIVQFVVCSVHCALCVMFLVWSFVIVWMSFHLVIRVDKVVILIILINIRLDWISIYRKY